MDAENPPGPPGTLTISLDFELYWGVRDKRTLDEYRENLAGVRLAIDSMLGLFRTHKTHATWAVVGFLFFEDAAELRRAAPSALPTYRNPRFSPYRYVDDAAGAIERDLHFAPEVIERIRRVPGQEIGTHTFSHYYCLEEGQTKAAFRADLEAATAIAKRQGLETVSLVFPRNQWNPDYLDVLRDLGIRCFRGNPDSPLYRASDEEGFSLPLRGLRLLDAYLNLTGHHTFSLTDVGTRLPLNLPASRFLRPYSKRLRALEGLRLQRILEGMKHAARNGRVFHLWWHPHNFGVCLPENLRVLERILEHHQGLEERYGMQSRNMGELCAQVEAARGRG